jgi:hypothetical protein
MNFGVDLSVRADLVRLRPGNPAKTYFTADDDPAERGAVARVAMADCAPNDVLLVGPGVFKFPHTTGNVVLPSCLIKGSSMTTWISDVWSDNQGTAFVLQNTCVQDMTLNCQTYIPTEDGRTTGFDPQPGQTAGFAAVLTRCLLIGNAWTVYNWNNLGNTLSLEDCVLKYGRIGIAAMGSGGGSQFFAAHRCHFQGDASLSQDIGATSSAVYGGVYGAINRSGLLQLIDCSMNLVGKAPVNPSFTPRVVGVTDTFEIENGVPVGASGDVAFEICNLRMMTVNPNGATFVKDLSFNFSKSIKQVGGWGSGPNGAWVQ